MVIPYASFPVLLAEQQIAYMAAPSALGLSYTGKPVGTGPFKFKSWSVGVESQFTKNAKLLAQGWRRPSPSLLRRHHVKTIVDSASRNEALQSGDLDMILQETGAQIAQLKKMSGISMVTDETQPRDPSLNVLIVNTTGTMNQYFAWAGEFAPSIPGRCRTSKGDQAFLRSPRRYLRCNRRCQPVDAELGPID